MLIACLAFLSVNAMIWPVMTYRFAFATWPAIVPLLAAGMTRSFQRLCSWLRVPKYYGIVGTYLIVVSGTALTIAAINKMLLSPQ